VCSRHSCLLHPCSNMNDNLTVNTLAFNRTWSDQAGSQRREVSRGANLPEIMSVKHTDIIDSATKLPARRSMVRFDRQLALSTGIIAPVSAYIVVQVPKDTGVVSSDITAVLDRLGSLLAKTSNPDAGLQLGTALFVNCEQ